MKIWYKTGLILVSVISTIYFKAGEIHYSISTARDKFISNTLVSGLQAIAALVYLPEPLSDEIFERTIIIAIPDFVNSFSSRISEAQQGYMQGLSMSFALKNELSLGIEIGKTVYKERFGRKGRMLLFLFGQHALISLSTYLARQSLFAIRDYVH